MTTDERIEKPERERAGGWLFAVVMASAVMCRIVVTLAMCFLLVVRGQQSNIHLEALSDPAWWAGELGGFIGISMWGAFLVLFFLVLRKNIVLWHAGTHTFGVVLRIIIAAPIFFVASLGVGAWVFGFWLGDLARVIWRLLP
jgi:hypothetical protein